MIEKKVDKEILYAELDTMSGMERDKVVAIIVDKYGYKESSALTKYNEWKSEFKKPNYKMHHKLVSSEKAKKNAIEVAEKDFQKNVEAKIIPNKPSLPEIEDSEELKLNRQAIEEVESNQQSITIKPEIADKKSDKISDIKQPIEFVPLTFKGKHYVYEITKENLLIEEGQTTIITKEGIEEQLEALEIWEKYKELI